MADRDTTETCPECGARVTKGAERCDLCGFPLYGAEDESYLEEEDLAPGFTQTPTPQVKSAGAGVFCNTCGWKNPPGAKFCSQCGTPLQAVAAASIPPPRRARADRDQPEPDREPNGTAAPHENVNKRVAIIVAAAALLVIALYLVTVLSRNVATENTAMTADTSAVAEGPLELPPLAPELSGRVAELEAEIEGLSGEAKLARQQDLVNIYLDARRVDHAALVQQEIAQALNTTEAWTIAGNLLYGWMQQDPGPNKAVAGRRAIAAYQRVLEAEPENLGIRTDLATAYLGTNNPMEGVRQIRMVLEADSNHVQANFNYGVMLSMIGRVDQAIAQFEKVQRLEPAGSDNHQLAERAIEQLQTQHAQQ